MVRHAVLVTWRKDVDLDAVDSFVAGIPQLFSDAPFEDYRHGMALRLSPRASTDWAYVADFVSEGAYRSWVNHPAHNELRKRMTPLMREWRQIQF